MQRKFSKNKKNGFTLIETIVMIVVIGLVVSVLIGVILSMFETSHKKALSAKLVDDIRILNDAQTHYYSKHRLYGTKEQLVDSGFLKQWPIPNPEMKDETCLNNTTHVYEYQYWSLDINGDGSLDMIAVLPCVKSEYAELFNGITIN